MQPETPNKRNYTKTTRIKLCELCQDLSGWWRFRTVKSPKHPANGSSWLWTAWKSYIGNSKNGDAINNGFPPRSANNLSMTQQAWLQMGPWPRGAIAESRGPFLLLEASNQPQPPFLIKLSPDKAAISSTSWIAVQLVELILVIVAAFFEVLMSQEQEWSALLLKRCQIASVVWSNVTGFDGQCCHWWLW